jgi:hypothetical protein
MMSDERFFNQVKATMADYSPEVPAAVYGGMRRKLWWSNFTRLSATRLNIWYVAIALLAGMSGWAYLNNKGTQASLPLQYDNQLNWSVPVSGSTTAVAIGNAQETANVSCASTCSSVKKAQECGPDHGKPGCIGAASVAETHTSTELSYASSGNVESQPVIPAADNTDVSIAKDSSPAGMDAVVPTDAKPEQGRKKLKVPVFTNQSDAPAEKK